MKDIPEIKIHLGDKQITFDMDNPVLPEAIEDNSFSSGGYPYEKKLKRKDYEEKLEQLHLEMAKFQKWMLETEQRIVLVFEGRDAAGKGGTINAFRQYLNPRHSKAVALSKPSDVERGQWYFQRYVDHLPTKGQMIMFDRSWYNRAGVEPVMGFCSQEQHEAFLDEVPYFENMLVRDGILFFKFWLNVGQEMQIERFHDRRHNPLKDWKLSPIDIKALSKWDDYTAVRDVMMKATHTENAPWTIVRSNDKRRARINAIQHFLNCVEYDGKDAAAIGDTDPLILGQGPQFFNEFGC